MSPLVTIELFSLRALVISSWSLQQKSRDRRGHEIRERSGEHGPQTEPREIVTPVRRERSDAADLNADRAEVGEPAEREGCDRERSRIERRLQGPKLRIRDKLIGGNHSANQVAISRHTHHGTPHTAP